jgi:hypothetical protein
MMMDSIFLYPLVIAAIACMANATLGLSWALFETIRTKRARLLAYANDGVQSALSLSVFLGALQSLGVI